MGESLIVSSIFLAGFCVESVIRVIKGSLEILPRGFVNSFNVISIDDGLLTFDRTALDTEFHSVEIDL